MKKITLAVALTLTLAPMTIGSAAAAAYAGADVGLAKYSGMTQVGGNYSNPLMTKVFAGYQFNRYFASEVGYAMLGSVNVGAAAPISGQSWQVAAIGTIPVSDRFGITGKLGVDINQYQQAGTNGGSAGNLLIGIGAKYLINDEFSARIQLDKIGNFGTLGTTQIKASSLSIGVAIGF